MSEALFYLRVGVKGVVESKFGWVKVKPSKAACAVCLTGTELVPPNIPA